MRTTPGTPTLRPDSTASLNGIGAPPLKKRSGLAAADAVSRPSYVSTACCPASQCTRNAPPPRPDDCGSTSPSTSCVAIAASTADPPLRRISRPAWAASGLAATTMWCCAMTRLLAVLGVAPSGGTDSCAAAPETTRRQISAALSLRTSELEKIMSPCCSRRQASSITA